MTNFKEQTNTFLYKKIPLTLYSRKGDVSYVGEVSWRQGQTATYWPPSSSDHSSTSFAFWLDCSTMGHWGPKPSVWSWFSLRWHPISNWNCLCAWLYYCSRPTCFRCSSAYLYRCISWLMVWSRANMLH